MAFILPAFPSLYSPPSPHPIRMTARIPRSNNPFKPSKQNPRKPSTPNFNQPPNSNVPPTPPSSFNSNTNENEDNGPPLSPDLAAKFPEAQHATPQQLARLLQLDASILGPLAAHFPSLRHRLLVNPRLPIQLLVELTVGSVCKTLAELHDRQDRFLSELDLYASDMALELVSDAMLVWLLSPVAAFGASKRGRLSALPKHFGQIGAFSPAQRGAALLFKGGQFALIGFASSLVGHGATSFLVEQRRKKQGVAREDMPAVLPTSLVWGGFLMTSSNVRYQIVNAVEQRVLDPLLGRRLGVLTLSSFALRFGNCLVGGMQWLPFARHFGIQ